MLATIHNKMKHPKRVYQEWQVVEES